MNPSTPFRGGPFVVTPQELEEVQRRKLVELLGLLLKRNPFYQRKLHAGGFTRERLEASSSLRELLSELPFTSKAELDEDQHGLPPYGTNLTYPLEKYQRLHQTSGTQGRPIRWLDTRESWETFGRCWEIIYRAMGLEASDRIFFPFSFGPFIGFWGAFDGACRLGNLCLTGGGMSTVARLRCLLANDATVVACTPTYALRMAEVAGEEGLDLAGSAVRALIVAGEPGGSVPSTKRRIESAWGARVFDHCGMTEVGAFGFEARERPGGLYVIETEFVAEVVDVKSGEPVPEGTEGELVLTTLARSGMPVVRYRSGDLVKWSSATPLEGYPFGRLEGGILTRLDEMVFVRGNNVHPAAMESVLRGFDEISEYRVRVSENGAMTVVDVEIEPAERVGPAQGNLAQRVAAAIEETFFFRAAVRVVPSGALPRFELKAKRFVREDPSARRT